MSVKTWAIDIETTGLDPFTDELLSIGVTDGEQVLILEKETAKTLPEIIGDSPLVFHNAQFDVKFLYHKGIDLRGHRWTDTMLLHHLLKEEAEHGLGAVVLDVFGDNYKSEFWSKYKTASDAPPEELHAYNVKDVTYTWKLNAALCKALRDDGVPDSLIDLVHGLQRSLLDTEIRGIAVDLSYLEAKGVELQKKIVELRQQMRDAAPVEIEDVEMQLWLTELDKRKTDKGKANVKKPEFSFDSAKHLMKLLYEVMGLPPQFNEKTKNRSVDWDSLEKLREAHPIVPLIQQYREHFKVYSAYIEGTLERQRNGRIYPEFNVNGTVTGRISHRNPNLGQLPREGGVRGIYIPDPGFVFISADFSQLEVRLSAHFTQDRNLLAIVNEGKSQHDITASSLGISRHVAKTLNFGMQYGCSHFKVAKILGVSEQEGKRAFNKYWQTYSGQKRVMDECARKVDTGVPIQTPFGRKRRFEVKKRQTWDSAYRQSWNALVQGTGSDCTSLALVQIDCKLKQANMGYVLFSVHDEIIISVKREHASQAEKMLVDEMQAVGVKLNLTVPLVAESSGPMDRWE